MDEIATGGSANAISVATVNYCRESQQNSRHILREISRKIAP